MYIQRLHKQLACKPILNLRRVCICWTLLWTDSASDGYRRVEWPGTVFHQADPGLGLSLVNHENASDRRATEVAWPSVILLQVQAAERPGLR